MKATIVIVGAILIVAVLLSGCKTDVFDIMNPERQRTPAGAPHLQAPYHNGQQESGPPWVEQF